MVVFVCGIETRCKLEDIKAEAMNITYFDAQEDIAVPETASIYVRKNRMVL